MMRAFYRLIYAGRLNYVDFHPGNFLFHDGVLGLLDFGCVADLRGYEWAMMERLDHAVQTGSRADIADFAKDWYDISDEPSDRDRFECGVAYIEHFMKLRLNPGAYDFSNAADLRTALRMMGEMVQKRYTRGYRTVLLYLRWEYSYRTTMYRLGAQIDVHQIRDAEVRSTGWAHV